MLRQSNFKKQQNKNWNELDEIPLKKKRRQPKEKYRHQKKWLNEEDVNTSQRNVL